jgi:hypothetical protein
MSTRLNCETLEGRETPALAIHFVPDATVPDAAVPVLGSVAAYIGNRLNPPDLTDVTIRVSFADLPPDRVAEGGPGLVRFDSLAPWYFGVRPGQTGLDFYTVASHELGHALGIGTRDRWADEAVKRGVRIDPDGQHVGSGQDSIMTRVVADGRRVFTELDFALLDDQGYRVSFPPRPTRFLLSVPTGDGLCRLYLIDTTTGTVRDTGFRSPLLVVFGDVDKDGTPDLLFSTAGPGLKGVVDGASGSVYNLEAGLGEPFLLAAA